MMEDDAKQELHNTYIATCETIIARFAVSFGGGDWPFPSYYELMHPDAEAKDERTEEDIRAHVLELFGGEENGCIQADGETGSE